MTLAEQDRLAEMTGEQASVFLMETAKESRRRIALSDGSNENALRAVFLACDVLRDARTEWWRKAEWHRGIAGALRLAAWKEEGLDSLPVPVDPDKSRNGDPPEDAARRKLVPVHGICQDSYVSGRVDFDNPWKVCAERGMGSPQLPSTLRGRKRFDW